MNKDIYKNNNLFPFSLVWVIPRVIEDVNIFYTISWKWKAVKWKVFINIVAQIDDINNIAKSSKNAEQTSSFKKLFGASPEGHAGWGAQPELPCRLEPEESGKQTEGRHRHLREEGRQEETQKRVRGS